LTLRSACLSEARQSSVFGSSLLQDEGERDCLECPAYISPLPFAQGGALRGIIYLLHEILREPSRL